MHEVLGAQFGERPVERQHEDVGDAQRLEQAQLEAERGELERRVVGAEETARVRLEGEHAQAGFELAGQAPGLGDDRLMTAVNLPTISSAATNVQLDNSQNGTLNVQGENLTNVRAIFLVPTDRTREIRLGGIEESASGTTVIAQIFAGLPAKTYNVVVVTREGISAPSSDSITIDPQILPPIVRRLSQVVVAEGTGPTIRPATL